MTPPPEFIAVPYEVFTDPSLSHAAKMLFSRLKLYAGKDGKAYPKHETLAREMCMSGRQVRTVLAELKSLNRIGWGRTRTSCIYGIRPPEDWKKASDLDRKNPSGLIGRKLPIKTGRKLPTEERFLRSSSKRGSKENPEPAAVMDSEPGKLNSLKIDDDGPKAPETYATPQHELRAIYRSKTGEEISLKVERRIWEAVELRGASQQQFLEELRKHTPNAWKNPAGFLTSFARSISRPDPEPEPQVTDPPKNAQGRCAVCGGSGYTHWGADVAARLYCDCRMGRDLQKVEARPTKEAAADMPPATATVQ